MSVRETLELDISDALASIEQVGDRLTNVAQAFGEVLSEALEAALNGLPVITPEVNTTPVSDEVEQALTEASATPVDVTVEVDAESITDEAQAAVDAVDGTIEVSADVGSAEEALGGLSDTLGDVGGSGEDAAGGLGGVASAAVLAGRGAADASGPLGRVSGALSALGPTGVAAGAAIGGVAVGAGFLYNAAFEAVAVTQSWNQSLGDLAPRIEDLSGGTTGLSTSLRQLAQDTGSSDEAVLVATQRYAEFQRAAGFTNDQIVENSQGIATLAAQIRVNNPQLGTMDQIITTLGRSLQRGGPRLQQFGIALNSADIEARALTMSGKSVASELTNAEKSAAGLSIALEQVNPNAESLAAGMENVAIQSERAQQKIGDTLEALGKPLVEPVTEAFLALASAFEAVGAVVAPLYQAIGEDLADALDTASVSLDAWMWALQSISGFLGDATDDAEDASGALDVLGVVIDAVTRNAIDQIPVLGRWINLINDVRGATDDSSESVVTATGTNTNYAESADEAGVAVGGMTAEMKAQQFVAEQTAVKFQPVYDGYVAFAEAMQRSIPTVREALGQITEDTTADQITANLDKQIAATDRWATDIQASYALGLDNISRLLVEIGPTQSAILLDQYRGREQELEDHLQLMAEAQQRAATAANQIALRGYLELRGLTADQANAVVLTLGAELQLGVPTQAAIDEVIKAPETRRLAIIAAYQRMGSDSAGAVAQEMNSAVGATISGNLIDGMTKEAYARTQRVRDALNAVGVAAIEAINAALGNRSPSREMAIVGDNAVAGLVVGINRSSGLVDDAMGGLASDVLGVSLSAGAPTIRDVTVQVPVTVSGGMTADDGRAIGAAAGQAAAAEVARMMRLEARVA